MNVAVNARDAMPEGGNLIVKTSNVALDEGYARTHPDSKPGRHVLLMVRDTGEGMDKETLEHIFEPFYTTKAAGEGTGLGLAMVHGIVHQHGGHITCESERGQGTTFKIYFPAVVSEELPEETSARAMPRGGSETILLVDDEEVILDLGSRILMKAGYKVMKVSNGKEALEVYRQRSDEISLVILDLIMPEMGGKQCLEGLLSLDPNVKVVIASGFALNGATRETIETGAKGYVGKPFDIRQLLGTVRKVLDEA
jgi:CheY-like chemotaxis protein